MGIAVIGGLVYASLLTLYVIPAVYTFFSSKSASVSNLEAAGIDPVSVTTRSTQPETETHQG